MTLRDPNAYRDAAWDWGIFESCFGGSRIRISDIDGVVETQGRVLFLEAKPPGRLVTGGQAYLFDVLVRVPTQHVLVLYGVRNEPTLYQWWPDPPVECDLAVVQAVLKRWFDYGKTPRDPKPEVVR